MCTERKFAEMLKLPVLCFPEIIEGRGREGVMSKTQLDRAENEPATTRPIKEEEPIRRSKRMTTVVERV